MYKKWIKKVDKSSFVDSYVDVGPLESLRRQKVKYLFFDFYIAFKRFLTCGNDRSRQIIAKKNQFKSEKLAFWVELWPKHSQKRILVPMLYIKLFSSSYLSFF